jgi:hypothetical protein
MSEEVLAVLTRKSVETILELGGTQSWSLNRAHAIRCRYAVLCRNARHPDVEGPEPHGSAFMIGRIADVVPSTQREGRWLIRFSEYAVTSVPDVWKGWRSPVRYGSFDDFGVDLDGIEFQPMAPTNEAHPRIGSRPSSSAPAMLTIDEAKKALAATFGVKPEAVEITIRG